MSRPSAADRRAAGRAIRSEVPRSAHGEWRPPDSRTDPVQVLRGAESERVPDLLGLRHTRMAASPFGFLRGSAGVMASDLATTAQSGLRVQSCGDAHIGNFRLLGTPERKLNFDLNDFDETLPAPFEWDLKRLVTSAVVVARHNGFSTAAYRRVADSITREYESRMAAYALESWLDVWYSHLDSVQLSGILKRAEIDAEHYRRAMRRIRKARKKDHLRAVRRLTTRVDGVPRLIDDPPELFHTDRDDEVVAQTAKAYRSTLPPHMQVLFDRYELVDYAMKVVGVGSVGTRCWVVLFDGGDDLLVLQVKQAGTSVLEPYAGPSRYRHHGQRVVQGQRLIQAAGDIFLGWTRGQVEGIDYYVRQLWDMKGKLDTDGIDEDSLTLLGDLCGWTLARAHARSGDPAAISGYIGKGNVFIRAVTDFAVAYADQTVRDHERLCAAIRDGEIPGDL